MSGYAKLAEKENNIRKVLSLVKNGKTFQEAYDNIVPSNLSNS